MHNSMMQSALFKAKKVKAIEVAILDGVFISKEITKCIKTSQQNIPDLNIMSSLVFREFLYQI